MSNGKLKFKSNFVDDVIISFICACYEQLHKAVTNMKSYIGVRFYSDVGENQNILCQFDGRNLFFVANVNLRVLIM